MMMPSTMILTICISMVLKRNRGLSLDIGSRYQTAEHTYIYLLTPMDCTTLLHVKLTISHSPESLITRQRASVDSKLLHTLRNVGLYHIFER